MAYNIIVEKDGSGVVVTCKGSVSGEEVMAANDAMYAGDQRGLLRYQIWDCSDADRFDVSEEQVRAIALQDQRAAERNPNQVVALVGTPTFFIGADRRYAIYSDVWGGFESKTFRTMAEARAWVASVQRSP